MNTTDISCLSHYTSNIQALSNICSGEFWATDINDFDDKCEGILILRQINEIISDLNIFSDNQKQYIYDLIGDDKKIENFIKEHRTAVLSMCLDTDSEYLWDNYAKKDGYNIIFAWEDLKELAKENIEAARGKLMDVLCNYQGYRKMTLILVFDAYKVPGYTGEVQKYHNIYVVYTKEQRRRINILKKWRMKLVENTRSL